MLNSIAHRIVSTFLSDSECSDTYEICAYGVELFLYSIISTLGLILIGIILNSTTNCFIIILVFYTCQSYGGGKHANSHIKCFGVMAAFMVTALLICFFNIPLWLSTVFATFSLVYLFMRPLVLHPHKEYLLGNKNSMEAKSRLCTLCHVLVYCITCITRWKLCAAYSLALAYAAVSRHLGYQSYKNKDISKDAESR